MSFKRLLPVRFAARQSGVSQYADAHRLPEPAGGGSGCGAVEASLARQGSSDGPRIATRYSEARHLGAL
jgi:hypothetical protein